MIGRCSSASVRLLAPSTRSFATSLPHFAPSPPSSSTAAAAPPPTKPRASSNSSHLTPAEEASKAAEIPPGRAAPAPLSRALGVKAPPVRGYKPTREEWQKNLVSPSRRLNERKHLVKEVSKGYFHDYNELRHEGGKAWLAPSTLIRPDLARYFPDIEGVRLTDKAVTHTTDLFKNKVSVVVFSSFQSSEEHINSFVRPTLSDLSADPSFQYVYINLQENPLKGFLVTMFLSSLRQKIPKEQQASYLLSHQSLEYLREPMGMTNKHVGYVFLVDDQCRIRWAGCDWATPVEEESLRKCAHVLLDRLKSGAA